MKKYIFLIIIFLIAFFTIHNVYALDGSYSSSNFQIFYYNSPSGGTRLSSGYSSGLDVSLSPNGGYLEGLYIQVFGSNNIIYEAGNTYTFDFRVNFNPKKWNYLDNNYTSSNINVLGSTSASSTGMTADNITSKSLSITNISGNTYQMHYIFTIVPNVNLKYILFQCFYPYSLLGSDLEYVYALSTVRVVDLTVSYQQGIGSAIDNQTIIIQNGVNDVINNNNQNTNSIINNNNQNTQDIINNQNSNTQQQIESQKVCTYIDKSNVSIDNSYLSTSGGVISSGNHIITNYISIDNSTTIKVLSGYPTTTSYVSYCFYNTNKSLISCSALSGLADGTNLTIPTNASYFRSTIAKSTNKPTYNICKNGNQAMSDGINNINDSLNNSDSTGATNEAGSFFSNFNTDTHGLTGIITAPLSAIQGLINDTCSPLVLPLPFVNRNLTLPCLSSIYSNYFGSFFTMYQTITLGIVSYWVLVRIFALVKDFKNPEHDEIEVVEL